MALQIIGSGFGRTGTMSTKMALEQLGFGPCHHMIEVIENPAQPAHWKAIAAGQQVPLAEVFEGYNSQVDWPGAAVWRETSVAFPDAKVLHTERPEDEWWNSFSVTIGKFFDRAPNMSLPPHIADIFQTMSGWFMKNTFADHTDRALRDIRLSPEQRGGPRYDPGGAAACVQCRRGLGPALPLSGNARTRSRRFRAVIRGMNSGRISAASRPNLQRTLKTATRQSARGESFAHRSFHALPKTIRRSDGKGAGAIVGFANFLLRFYADERPRAVIVAWIAWTRRRTVTKCFPPIRAGRVR